MRTLFFLIIILTSTARASTNRTIDGDAVRSTVNGTTVTMPAASGVAIISAGLVQEQPSGTVNGTTTAFTLANTPGASATVTLTLDGLILTQGSGKDYTISGATITMAVAPSVGQTLWAVYSKF